MAEDWIASTTRATNRGREHLAEGVSQVRVGHDPAPRDFAALLASDAEYFLGAAHVAKFGAQPQVLVKFLDSGTRLHFQVHPTREFARHVLGAPSGKTEAYHVLAIREVERVDPNALVRGLQVETHEAR
jgi:mannose-6-phosphate isomerase